MFEITPGVVTLDVPDGVVVCPALGVKLILRPGVPEKENSKSTLLSTIDHLKKDTYFSNNQIKYLITCLLFFVIANITFCFKVRQSNLKNNIT